MLALYMLYASAAPLLVPLVLYYDFLVMSNAIPCWLSSHGQPECSPLALHLGGGEATSWCTWPCLRGSVAWGPLPIIAMLSGDGRSEPRFARLRQCCWSTEPRPDKTHKSRPYIHSKSQNILVSVPCSAKMLVLPAELMFTHSVESWGPGPG